MPGLVGTLLADILRGHLIESVPLDHGTRLFQVARNNSPCNKARFF